MTLAVQITIIALGLLLLLAILIAAFQKKITESHALLWILPCLVIVIGGIFPGLTYILSDVFNTSYPPAIIFALAIIIVYLILFQCFKTLSVLTMQNKELASAVSLLTERIRQLEAQVNAQEEIPQEKAEEDRT
ncbi:MAG: DUF2304 domain-containing protein [Clostridiaceae bacterium]|nr:DUF2304 domain-containing protein [Clostridiaceae bacterium]